MRRREPITRDSTGGDPPAGLDCSAHDDETLLRATADILRRVHAAHPAGTIDLVRSTSPGQPRVAIVRANGLTWTPIDSDKRGGGAGGDDGGGVPPGEKDVVEGARAAHARGIGADWHRFAAVMRAAAGKTETLEQLCRSGQKRRAGGGGGGGDDGDEHGDRRVSRRGSTQSSQGESRRRGRGRSDALGASRSNGRDGAVSVRAPPLGASLLFLHAVEVFVSDAAARLAVFESRVTAAAAKEGGVAATTPTPSTRVSWGETSTPAAADTLAAPWAAAPLTSPPSAGVPESPQPASASAERSGAWAIGVLQNSILYRFVSGYIPNAERTSFFNELLDMAVSSAEMAAARAPPETTATKMGPPPPLTPGTEEVAPDEIAAAAHRLLARLSDLIDAMEGATEGNMVDRTLGNIRRQLDDCVRDCWRHDPRLYEIEAKRAFLGAMQGTAAHKLRAVRNVLQATVMARHSLGIMRGGVGDRQGNPAAGAIDVFQYVAADPDRAIKSQKDSDGSADYCESIGRLGLMIAASAQAAAGLAHHGGEPTGVMPEYAVILREAARVFFAQTEQRVVPKVAAAVDAALGSAAT